MAVGADDFADKQGRVFDAQNIGAEGADFKHAEARVGEGDRVFGAPFLIRYVAGADEIYFRFERAVESV